MPSMAASLSKTTLSLAADSKVVEKTSDQTSIHNVRLFDENGVDITPRPLYQSDGGLVQAKLKVLFTGDTFAGSGTDLMSTLFPTATNTHSTWPFTRSFLCSSSVSRSSHTTMESRNEEFEVPSGKKDIPNGQVGEDMLDDVVEVYLSETETISLLDIPGVSVSVDADDAESVGERNAMYAELCANRAGNDKYAERAVQTFNGAAKSKRIQCDRVNVADAATEASTWDLYVSLCGAERDETTFGPQSEKVPCPEGVTEPIGGSATASSSCSDVEPVDLSEDSELVLDSERILQSEAFQHCLFIMERSVLENIFQAKQAAYRQLPPLEDCAVKPEMVEPAVEAEQSSLTPTLRHLWDFCCDLTAGRNISCMAWNKKNTDILAVGYGQFTVTDPNPGLVCCWSLKNPKWPERVFHCESGVTALDFSTSNPSLLAVGMHSGTVAVYNVQSPESAPVMDSSDCANRPLSPQWQVRWIEHSEDRGRGFLSVCADGRISKWFLRHGSTCRDLMKLKRTGNDESHKNGKQTRPFISKHTPGLSFAFHPMDSNLYLVGTEEGHIHKFSCSNSEQTLETYRGHKGPVYCVTWSPFCPDVFLSCSSDWTVRLWRQDLLTPVLSFPSAQRGFYDVAWSPRWATVFAAASEGRVEVWNLGSSILDPTIVHDDGPIAKTSVLFATPTDCVLVGDGEGKVGVYRLENLTLGEGDQVDTLKDIINRMRTSNL